MSQDTSLLNRGLLTEVLSWFQPQFRQQVVAPIESQFPGYPLPNDIQKVLASTGELLKDIQGWQSDTHPALEFETRHAKVNTFRLPLFKQIVLLYRRHRAAHIESLTEKTFHLDLTESLELPVKSLDALVNEEWFQSIKPVRLPRLVDYLPIQLVEAAALQQVRLPPRQYDQKFPILQSPSLFLLDLAYFRAKCEERESLLAIAFLDIDHFKQFNTDNTETKVDRNLLPKFMHTIESHVYHHGYAYHEGGDEFMLLLPSLSKPLSVAFLDELRLKLSQLDYPDIKGRTTVSIGLCILAPNCPLTDRELRDRASHAKKFAKENGRNCIASYDGERLIPTELIIVAADPE
jgi:diguanylate cyclase (GGDEF)-like protein